VGLAIGLCAALALVLSWRVPAEGGTLGADARFTALPPGELVVEPEATFLKARRLRPGGPAATGSLRVRNISPRSVAVRGVALPSSGDLDSRLRVELRQGDDELFSGRLGRLRRGTARMRLLPDEERRVEARAWLPAGTAGHEGAAVDVTLELRVEVRP
jgi:hypothetical protein